MTPTTIKLEQDYEDGSPFTKDECGNVYDRWSNKIYEASACKVSGYTLVPTSTK